jgi:hypothetical protein
MEFLGEGVSSNILGYAVQSLLIYYDENSKQAVNYQLVCKNWYHVINNPYFNKVIFVKPKHIAKDIWDKIVAKYPKFLQDKSLFYHNLIWYTCKILPEYLLWSWNVGFQRYVGSSFDHHTYSIEHLTLPTYMSPNALNRYLSEVHDAFVNVGNRYFLNWLDHLIELYYLPYRFEPLVRDPHFLEWNMTKRTSVNSVNHNIYWQVITESIIAAMMREHNSEFLDKYFADLYWGHSKIFQIVDQQFISSHSILWNYWNVQQWNKICIEVRLSEDFIEKIIINELFHQRKMNINFAYVFKNQHLSEDFIERIFINADNRINNDTNWHIIMDSNYVSDEFKEKHSDKKQSVLSSSWLRSQRTIKKSDIKFF